MDLLGVFVVVTAAATIGHIAYVELTTGRRPRLLRKLARRPRTAIAAVSGGLVHVAGIVHARGAPLRAPITGRACVGFDLVIERWRGSSRNTGGGGWKVLLSRRDVRPFIVIDETGEATIDTGGPKRLFLSFDETGFGSVANDAESAHLLAAQELLESAGVVEKDRSGRTGILRFREAALTEGKQVSVGGLSTRDVIADGERASPRSPPERIVLRGYRGEPLLVTDSNLDPGSSKTTR